MADKKPIFTTENDQEYLEVDVLWQRIEEYADAKASHELAQEVASGNIAIEQEERFDKIRIELRSELGLPEEK